MQSSAAESTSCAGPTPYIVLPSPSLNLAWSGPAPPVSTRSRSPSCSTTEPTGLAALQAQSLGTEIVVLAGIIVLEILHTAGSNTFWEVTGV
jgi:hypothetical protein